MRLLSFVGALAANSVYTAIASLKTLGPSALAAAEAAVEAQRRLLGLARPAAIGLAPGRVNLIGEHTDYADGLVLPMAIDRWCAAAVTPLDTPQRPTLRLLAADLPNPDPVDVALQDLTDTPWHQVLPAGDWRRYVAGVAALMLPMRRGLGRQGVAPSLAISVAGNVPFAAGLSSSAALELAVVRALAAMWLDPLGDGLTPLDAARLAVEAERLFAQVPCGIMDQFSASLARADHAMLIDCRDQTVTHLPIDLAHADEALVAGGPGLALLVLHTASPRHLADGFYAMRVAAATDAAELVGLGSLRGLTDLPPHLLKPKGSLASWPEARLDEARRAASHIVSENTRVRHFASLLARPAGDAAAESARTAELGRLLNQSHDSLRRELRVSSPALDLMVELAIGSPGVVGARLTGAGFGGSAIALVDCQGRDIAGGSGGLRALCASIQTAFRDRTGLPGQVFVVRAAPGAAVL